MNEPMITDRRGREQGVRRFACPAGELPVFEQGADGARMSARFPLKRRIAAALASP